MSSLVPSGPRMRRASELFTNEMVRPMCARCERPVDDLRVKHDVFFHQVTITVRCHGVEDYLRLDEDQIVDVDIPPVFGAGHDPRWGAGRG